MMETEPKPGDRVNVEFCMLIDSGKKITGTVGRVTSDEIVINRRVYRKSEIVNIEVLDDEVRASA